MTISFSGLASGLDTSSWVESLTALKKAKVTTLEEEKENVVLSKETLNNIKSFFSSFRSMLEKVTDTKFGNVNTDLFTQNLANSSNADILTASATAEAKEATYNILVDKLATESSTRSMYITTYDYTSTADFSSKLTELGVNIADSGSHIGVMVNGVERGIDLTKSDTIATFTEKLNNVGVEASYDAENGRFYVNVGAGDIIDTSATGIVSALHLTDVNEGYLSNSFTITRTETIYNSATTATKLTELGVNLTGTNSVLTIEANGVNNLVTINQNTTVGDFVSILNSKTINAEFSNATGVLTITDAKITNEAGTNIKEALGFDIDIYSKNQVTKDLSHGTVVTTTTTATSGTKLIDIGTGRDDVAAGNNFKVVDSNNNTTTVSLTSADETVGDVLTKIRNAGLSASITSDGLIEIAGGQIIDGTFKITEALGLEQEPYTAMVTGNALTETVTVYNIVDLSTRLVDDLGVTEGYLEVTTPDGDKYYEKIYSGQTIGNLMSDLGNLGIYSSLNEETGVLTITGGEFATLSDADVLDLINNQHAITEPDVARYGHGTNLIECLYGAPEISLNQTSVSSTRAKTKALRQAVTTTVMASNTTTLGQLGLENGSAEFNVNGQTITVNVTSGMTIDGFKTAMQNAGISVTFDEDTSRVEIKNATLVGGTSNLSDVLNLTTEISGKYKTSTALYANITTTINATEATVLSDFGILNSMSSAQRTVSVYNSDNQLLASTVVGEGTTIGNLLDFINAQDGVSASIHDGVITINDGYIRNATLEENMGLTESNKSSYVLGSIMTKTTTAAVTGDTTLAQVISALGTTAEVSGGYKLYFNSQELDIGAATSLDQLISKVYDAGGTAFLDVTGRLHVDGGTLTGSVAAALGIVSVTNTQGVSATGQDLVREEVVHADRETTLGELGLTGTKSLNIYDTLGNSRGSINCTANTTIGDVLDQLNDNYSFVSSISEGVISITSAQESYVSGEVASLLGIGTITFTQTVNTAQSSTLSVTHTGSVQADLTTTFENLGYNDAFFNSGDELIIKNQAGADVGTVNLTKTSTIQDMFDALSPYGIVGNINDGVITLYSTNDNYVTGNLADALGIGTVSGTTIITVGQSVTSDNAITYTKTHKATDADTISDYITNLNTLNKSVVVSGTEGNDLATFTVSSTSTFDELFAFLGQNGIDADLHDGQISLTTDGNHWIEQTNFTEALGITKTVTTETTTAGTSQTSSDTIKVTSTVEATYAEKVYDYITGGFVSGTNDKLVVKDYDNNDVGTVTLTSTSTFDDLARDLAALDVDMDIHSGVLSFESYKGNYIDTTSALASALGIQSSGTTITTTVGATQTSSSAIQYTTTVTATEDSKVSDFVSIGDGVITLKDETNTNAVGSFTISSTTTFGGLLQELASRGVDADLHNGVLTFHNSNTVLASGTALSNLGVDTTYTTVTTTVGATQTSTAQIQYTTNVTATEDSKISDFLANFSSYDDEVEIVLNNDNDTAYIYIDSDTTFGSLLLQLSEYGVDADMHDGVITFDKNNTAFVNVNNSEIIEALGITSTYTAVTTTVGAIQTSSSAIQYTTTVTATEDSKVSDFVNIGNGVITLMDETNTNAVGSFTISSTTTFGGLLQELAANNVDADLHNGVITFHNSNTVLATGTVLTNLGVGTSYETITTTVGATQTSSSAIQYTTNVTATEDSKVSDFVNIGNGVITLMDETNTNAVGSFTISSTTTFGGLLQELASRGVDADLHNGVLKFHNSNTVIATGTVLTNLGVGTDYTTVTTTVGAIQTSTQGIDFNVTTTAGISVTGIGLGDADTSTKVSDINAGFVNVIDQITDTTGMIAISSLNTATATFTSGTTYTISSTSDLQALASIINRNAANTNGQGAVFVLTSDLDLSSIADFTAIGTNTGTNTYFRGTFDGQGHTISGLTINKSGTSFEGLFGYALSATIRNLNLTDVNVTGGNYTGGLVGGASSTTIENVSVSGTVTGGNRTGGLVGYATQNTTIENVSVEGIVRGTDGVGGILGRCSDVTMSSSHTSANVTGSSSTGGLVGYNTSSTITNSYATGSVNGVSVLNGLTDLASLNTATATFTSGSTYVISSTQGLQNLASIINRNAANTNGEGAVFVLTSDLDLSSIADFTAIGGSATNTNFKGTFDGQGHTISGLTINKSGTSYQGLFGYADAATIRNLNLTDVDVTGGGDTGGLVGYASNNTTIENVSVEGSVNGSGYNTGGLVGSANDATIENVSVEGNITGTSGTGGLVGRASYNTTIENVSVEGTVTGGNYTGGLVGDAYGESLTIINASTSGKVSGNQSVGGVIGYQNCNVTMNMIVSASTVSGTSIVGELVGSKAGTITVSNILILDQEGLNNIGSGSYDTATNVRTVSFNPAGASANYFLLNHNGEDTFVFASPKDTINDLFTKLAAYDIEGTLSNGKVTLNPTGSTYIKEISQGMQSHLGISGAGENKTYVYNTQTANATSATTIGEITGPNVTPLDLSGATAISSLNTATATFTSGTTYTISSTSDLQALASIINRNAANTSGQGAVFVLTSDLDLSSIADFTAIGGSATNTNFKGTFDGQGHTISGLTINKSGTSYQGLFGYADAATIRNLNLTDVDVTGGSNTGGLVGSAKNATIENVSVKGSVNGSGYYTGGLVGNASNNTTIENVSVEGSVTGGDSTGGLVGAVYYSDINNASALNNVTGTNYVGGLVGSYYYSNEGDRTWSNLFSSGTVTATANNAYFGTLIGSIYDRDDEDQSVGYLTLNNAYAQAQVGIDTIGVEIYFDMDEFETLVYTDHIDEYRASVIQTTGVNSNYYIKFNNNGEDAIVFADKDDTLNDLFTKLAAYGISGDVTNGKVSFTPSAGSYITGISSGLKTALNITGDEYYTTSEENKYINTDSSCQSTTVTANATSATTIGEISGGANPLVPVIPLDLTRAIAISSLNTATATFTSGTTYTISSTSDLQALASIINRSATGTDGQGAVFVLTNDLDLSSIADWEAIGKAGLNTVFKGTFDGQGHTISGLTINKSGTSYQGLFGYANAATIRNLNLTDVDVTGGGDTGGLVGYADNTTIENVSVEGNVTGGSNTGGLVGSANNATIENVSVEGSVKNSSYNTGGLVGSAGNSTIKSSHTSANVAGSRYTGGLVGTTSGSTITSSYATGTVNGVSVLNGLTDLASLNTATATFTSGSTYVISSTQGLQNLALIINRNAANTNGQGAVFVLTSDLDLSSIANWTAIGTNDTNTYFKGTFDGQGHTISGLTINKSGTSYQGLFGYANAATIRNLNLTDVDVRGGLFTGGLVGDAYGSTIENVSVEGNVTGGNNTGGLAGSASGAIESVSVESNVTGSSGVGGLVGFVDDTGSPLTINNSSTSGTVSGTTHAGGVIGIMARSLSMNNIIAGSTVNCNSNGGELIGASVGTLNVSNALILDQEGLNNIGSGSYDTATNVKTASFNPQGASLNYIKLNHNGEDALVFADKNDTINDLFTKLSAYGISGAITNGKVSFTPSAGSYITGISDGLKNALKLTGNEYYTTSEENKYINTDSSRQNKDFTLGIETTTTLGQMLNSSGASYTINVNHEGRDHTITLNSDSSINDMFTALAGYGISGTLGNDGKITLQGTNDGYITSMTDGLRTGLKINTNYYSTSEEDKYINTDANRQNKNFTYQIETTTTLGQMLNSSGASYTINVNHEGRDHTITLNSDSSINDMFTALAGYGISGTLGSDGKITLQGTNDGYITFMTDALINGLKISVGNESTYETSERSAYINTDANRQNKNFTYQIETTTTLGQMLNSSGASYTINVNHEGRDHTITLNSDSSINDMFTALAGYGISGTLGNDGKITLQGTNDGYITSMTDGLRAGLKINTNYHTETEHTSFENFSTVDQERTTIAAMSTETLLGKLQGMSESGTYTVELTSAGNNYTVTVTGAQTVDDLISSLAGYGISGSVQNGKLTLTGVDDAFITSMNATLQNALKLQIGLDKTYSTATVTTTTNVTDGREISKTFTHTVDSTSTLGDFVSTAGSADYLINLTSYGVNYTVTMKASHTVDDMLTTLAGYGIAGSVTDGKVTLTGTHDSYITAMDNRLETGLKISDLTENTSYHTISSSKTRNTNSDEQGYTRNDLKITGDTKLNTISGWNNGNGKLEVHKADGTLTTITVDETKTVDQFFEQISTYGLVGSVDTDGRVTITGVGDVYLSSVTNGSNVLSALKLSNLQRNTRTITSNTTSDNLSHTVTVAATGTTTLENLELSNGTGITFSGNNVQLELDTYSDAGIQHVTLNFSKTDSLYTVMDKLAEYGIQATVDARGHFSISSSSLNDFDISGSLGTFLMGAYSKNYDETTTSNVSTNLVQRTIFKMTDTDTLLTFGITNGNILINQEGELHTVNIDTTQAVTVGDFRNLLHQYGFTTNIDDQGRLVVTGVGNSTISSLPGGSNIVEIFGLNNWDLGQITQTSSVLSDTTVTTSKTTMDRKLSELTDASGNNLGITSGNIYVYQDGTRTSVNINNEDTLSTLAGKLSQYGITMELGSDGQIYFYGDDNSYLTTEGITTASASNILTKLQVAGNTWSTRYNSISENLDYEVTENTVVNRNTKLSALKDSDGNDLGIEDGALYIYENGVRNTVEIGENDTVNDLMATMATFGLIADINENGEIAVSGHNNSYMETSMLSTKNSNLMSAMFGDTQWDFTNVYTSNGIQAPEDEIRAINRDTKLANIMQGDQYRAGKITVIKDGVQTDINLTDNDTVGTLIDELALYGFEGVINEAGQLILKATGDSKLQAGSVSNGYSNVLSKLGVEIDKWINTNTYESKDPVTVTKTENKTIAADRTTALSELGVTKTGEYYIYNNGVRYTALISSDETLGSLMDTLSTFGLQSSIVQDGNSSKLTVTGMGDSYVAKSNSTTNASDVVEKLFTQTVYTEKYTSDKKTQTISTTTTDATEASKLNELDEIGNTSAITSGTLFVNVNGTDKIIEVKDNDTIGDILERFRNIGIDAMISNGRIILQSGYDDLEISQDSTSNLKDRLTYKDNMGDLDGIHGFASSNSTVESTVELEKNVSVAQYASLSTDLDLVNISKGKLTFYDDGKRYQVEINDGWKFSDINSELARQGATVTLSFEDGFLSVKGADGHKIQVGATNDTSNFLAITGISTQSDGFAKSARELYCVNADSKVTSAGIFRDRQNSDATAQVTEGTFKVGDATITVGSDSTLSDIISQINGNSDAAAYAYWDNVKGELVIEATKTGSAFVNVEEGTSNFTYIMGLTTREDVNDSSTSTINIDAQTLGSNARFTINGTSYTASSNNITEDISRIKGVTIDLKDTSEGQVVKLKIERDKETLANAVGNVVDAYNSLMENVDKAIASDGQLHKETTLKYLRDQIKMLMTSTFGGTSGFTSLSNVGISVASAVGSNVSTSHSAIVALSFDKDKFMSKFAENQEAMKTLLVGLDGSGGVFGEVESTIEKALEGGFFTTAEKTYNKQITNLNEKISKANKAVERYRAQLEAKFKSMDMLIAQMQQQYSSFLKS